ncbi:nuclear transport factor 2 family protein [Lactiplantibacillus paraplantarum]|uniref:nuclear transport factor 2 family protein n=1 Tax=Lactiplantibacillus paraplantarum TaxID=60520 RepID=UPI0021A26EB9|nr:nuclear transport factor 2 family protein [Lactiplantibacillus paraplantarum]MCT4456206.1 nuclear transport factor 2 family protein [Lactiplantibacillus paraplantarum]
MNIQEISDRLELKTLVDNFSNYADTKDFDDQILLFTEDAVVNTIIDGKTVTHLEGRPEIQTAFEEATGASKSVFHMNGQQTVKLIDETHAKGINYTLVNEITERDGKELPMQAGARYDDTYLKVAGVWQIDKRNTNFVWSNIK